MGAPRLGLRGTAGQTYAVGRRDMGSKTCMYGRTQAAHRHAQSTQGSAQARTGSARQRSGACRQRLGGSAQHKGRAQAVQGQCAPATQTLVNDGIWIGLSWGALKDSLGRAWERHHAPSTE